MTIMAIGASCIASRLPAMSRDKNERESDSMSAPRLQTTIVGSLPKPAWLAQPSKLWAPWALEGDALEEAKRDATRLAVLDQERAGIDIVTDGEQSRRHF